MFYIDQILNKNDKILIFGEIDKTSLVEENITDFNFDIIYPDKINLNLSNINLKNIIKLRTRKFDAIIFMEHEFFSKQNISSELLLCLSGAKKKIRFRKYKEITVVNFFDFTYHRIFLPLLRRFLSIFLLPLFYLKIMSKQ